MASRADRFKQLTGAFDDPIAPSPAFAARLREHIVAELAAAPTSPAASPNGVKEDSMVATSTVPPTPIRRLRPGQRPKAPRYLRWTKPMALVNVAAILLLLVGIVRFFAPDKPAPDSTYRLPAIASHASGSPIAPNVSLNGSASMWGANPGRTWQMAATAPDLSGAALSTIMTGNGDTLITSTVISDEKIFAASAAPGRTFLNAYDIVTGRQLWSTPFRVSGGMVVRGNRLYFYIADSDTKHRLMALNTDDGSPLWTGPTYLGAAPPALGLVAEGDKLYASSKSGQVQVLDPETGKQLKLYSGEIGAALSNDLPQPGGSLTVEQGQIFVTTPQGTLRSYDDDSNRATWTSAVQQGKPGEILMGAELAVRNNVVIECAAIGAQEMNSNGKPRYTLVSNRITAYDRNTGRQLWTVETPFASANHAVLLKDAVVFLVPGKFPDALHGSDKDSFALRALGLQDGQELWQTDTAVGMGNVQVSAAGQQVYVVAADKLTSNDDPRLPRNQHLSVIEDGKVQTEVELPPVSAMRGTGAEWPRTSPEPAWLLGDTLFIVSGDGSVFAYGKGMLEATPVASPAASPQASPVAVQPGANRGQTYQYDVEVGTPKSETMLGAPVQGYIGSSAIVSDGTLYRTRTFYNSSREEQHSVEAVSLADGMSRTVFYDPDRAAINLMLKGDDLIVLSAPIVGRSTDTTLSVADANGRATRWSISLFDGAPAAQPLLIGNTVVVPAAAGKLYGVDLTTHKVAWTAAVPSPGNPTPWLAADAENLYVASGFYVTALDPVTGASRWQLDLSKQLYGIGAMRVADGQVVLSGLPYVPRERATPTNTPQASAASASARILSISTRDHTVRWHYDAPDMINGLGPIVDGRVLVGRQGSAPGGTTEALELKTGKAAWTHQGALAAVAAESQFIVIHISGLPQPGQTPATPAPGLNGPQFATPAVERTVTVTGLDPATGAVEWSMGESIGTTYPVAFLPIDRGLVIPLNDGRVMVLRG